MTRNQLHGKKFEDVIKACGLFPGASDSARGPTASFDIEARFDRDKGLPTSIKTTKGKIIGLSDARRFWTINEQFRMLAGHYKQIAGNKSFDVVHEFLITPEIIKTLQGEVTLEMVTEFHEGLSLRHFPEGKHDAARKWAKERKKTISGLRSDIVLNPKIDSQTQRRLQCSVKIEALVKCCVPDSYVVHTKTIGDIVLPFRLNSSEREFNK